MITLYGGGPHFGLPDASPFVVKAEMLLKLAKLPYECALMSFKQAPKGKIPYIRDGATLLGDSTLIRFHLEEKHGIDFDGGYDARSLAIAWSVEKMLEDHLYWLAVHDRWMKDENFNRGPRQFFKRAPAVVRPAVVAMIRRQVRKALQAQGTGRHSDAERTELARRDIDALSEILGENRYVLGASPCWADATVYAFVTGILCPLFESPARAHMETRANLKAYAERLTKEYWS
jgi:glutathione S-transferase